VALSENLDAFISTAEFAVAVTNGTTATTGILDMPSEIIAGNMVISTDYALTIKSSVYPTLKYGDSLTVAGAAYTVREVRLQDDGAFSVVYLQKV
jgi:riboflavin synthase alpha subunit